MNGVGKVMKSSPSNEYASATIPNRSAPIVGSPAIAPCFTPVPSSALPENVYCADRASAAARAAAAPGPGRRHTQLLPRQEAPVLQPSCRQESNEVTANEEEGNSARGG